MLPSCVIVAGLALTALAAPASDLAPRQGGCKKVHFIFARGSTETGTMGVTVGPAFSRALSTKFGAGNVDAVGVPYPADIGGAVSGAINPVSATGAVKMAAMAKDTMSRCPNTKIVLGGYSQGAEQVHGALNAKNLGGDAAKIAAAVTYGDPMKGLKAMGPVAGWGALPESRARVFCNSGDGVCSGAFSISAAHLSYTSNGDIAKGVDFVASVMDQAGQAATPGAAPSAGAEGAAPAAAKGKGMPKGKGAGGASPPS